MHTSLPLEPGQRKRKGNERMNKITLDCACNCWELMYWFELVIQQWFQISVLENLMWLVCICVLSDPATDHWPSKQSGWSEPRWHYCSSYHPWNQQKKSRGTKKAPDSDFSHGRWGQMHFLFFLRLKRQKSGLASEGNEWSQMHKKFGTVKQNLTSFCWNITRAYLCKFLL